jgi:uncharacterized protein (DUF2236 family)
MHATRGNAESVERQRDELAGYFGPESMTWRLAAESALLLGGGRAVLMQLAHPQVAAGVGQHSSWSSDPWGRTRKTIELTQQIAFGTRSEARAAARFINHLHVEVAGTVGWETPHFGAASPYEARDPALLMWVLATLVDTIFTVYPLLVGPLTYEEQELYYAEAVRSATLLGLPRSMAPSGLAAFRVYMREMLASETLAITPEARHVASVVMHMPAPLVVRPALMGAEQITIGLLPPRLRTLYGFAWDRRRQLLFDAWARATRELYSRVPEGLRIMPAARAARRRVRTAEATGECA